MPKPSSRSRVPSSIRRSFSRRHSERRNLAFESLERRELLSVSTLGDFSVNENTGEKPQAKVWEYNDTWYSVMPDKSGTWVWKLDGAEWSKELQLTSDDGYHADVKVVGNLAHVLLFDDDKSRLATIQYDHGPDDQYEMWSLRPSLVDVAISSKAETGVIEVDSTGRMWVAYDTSSSIEVMYADASSQYTNWSSPITVASGINSDDIGTIVAMPGGKIGVMWSNQKTDRFGFRYHVDGAAPNAWSADEVPASQSAMSKGKGMADDHINMAVASDGTIYAAVKTGYDSSGYPEIALLVRRPSGVWDNLYEVDTKGTRPIVTINEAANKLIVAYTASDSGGNIYFKESPLGNISFGARQTMISGSVNNPSSVKGGFTDEVVVIAGGGSKVKGSVFRFNVPAPPTNNAPTVDAGPNRTIQLDGTASLDGTVTDDARPNPTPTVVWSKVSGPGTVAFANATAVDTTATFSQAGTYVLRLTANDGQLTSADTMTVVVQGPVLPTNLPPAVNAGSNQTIQLPGLANLSATVTDTDGPLATPLLIWTRVSGPGTVTFGSTNSASTTAQFSASGTYVLRLTANDGDREAYDEVTITVLAEPTPPSSGGDSDSGSGMTLRERLKNLRRR